MRVRLWQDWGDERYTWAPAGVCRDVDDATGWRLVFAGVAEPVLERVRLAVAPARAVAVSPRQRKRKGRR